MVYDMFQNLPADWKKRDWTIVFEEIDQYFWSPSWVLPGFHYRSDSTEESMLQFQFQHKADST